MAFHRRTNHQPSYYLKVLSALIDGFNENLTYRQIADRLNTKGVLTPTGRPFSVEAITQLMKKLRNPIEYPSKIYGAMLQLVFEDKLNKDSAKSLLNHSVIPPPNKCDQK